jgi:hypothetical protein
MLRTSNTIRTSTTKNRTNHGPELFR